MVDQIFYYTKLKELINNFTLIANGLFSISKDSDILKLKSEFENLDVNLIAIEKEMELGINISKLEHYIKREHKRFKHLEKHINIIGKKINDFSEDVKEKLTQLSTYNQYIDQFFTDYFIYLENEKQRRKNERLDLLK